MTDEASKTRRVRGPDFEKKFLQGRVIDIGCGPDKIVAHAEPFDLEHGDAQAIATLRPKAAYDAVCSSHCLEHMRDVPQALSQWWTLVRPGGYLVLVVPDEDLYEQGGWPSLFNRDHKATFRLNKTDTWSPVSYDIAKLVGSLEGAEIISAERHDQAYDHSRRSRSISKWGRLMFRANQIRQGLFRRMGLRAPRLERALTGLSEALGAPIDQTSGGALAQIQVIARKRP
jgi:SAM-dependent methyltransferase